MAIIHVNKSDIQDHINETAEVKLESFSVSRPHYSFEWTRNGPDDPEVEFDVYVNDDLEYEFDISDCEEYSSLQSMLDEETDKNDELLASNDELIKENARLRARILELESKSFVNRIFGRLSN